ncbi:phosphate/phosphite/phosphonate ABC transporter substrate-binding protein [Spirulina sp. 06S082]|uniref:phosphate/phosphite/phosphonate ABC transporter substrate-binding protein n=1 Tax=Spirulina sp. 06S082 TaxID=3110248 RepID=UPI002B217DA1|nr:phosphate/phosphite/phosphonate ABC transporter substrate-binding protein [Spirulina sp. 06S082]MEA5472204.1 phosphate/phosphite/phosphonate ABC transporter substrate-binding protein [Spirulina sp. 06S082]
MIKRRNFLQYSLLFLAGCTTASQNSDRNTTHKISNWPTKLHFGISDVQDREILERDYATFRMRLEEVLETTIELVPLDNIVAVAPTMLAGELDLVWAGPSEYVVLSARAKPVPLVTLKRPGYRTVIVVPQESDIQSLADLQGKTLDIWKTGSTSHLGTAALFAEKNLQIQSDLKLVHLDPQAQLANLQAGKIDAFARGYTSYLTMLEKAGLSEDEQTRIIASTPEWPGDIFVASNQLDPEIVTEMRSRLLVGQKQLVEAILAIEDLSTRFEGASMEVAEDSDYDYMRQAYKAIGQESLIQ